MDRKIPTRSRAHYLRAVFGYGFDRGRVGGDGRVASCLRSRQGKINNTPAGTRRARATPNLTCCWTTHRAWSTPLCHTAPSDSTRNHPRRFMTFGPAPGIPFTVGFPSHSEEGTSFLVSESKTLYVGLDMV